MKVTFKFNGATEIVLTPESPREESLVKLAYESTLVPPIVLRSGTNEMIIKFPEGRANYEHIPSEG